MIPQRQRKRKMNRSNQVLMGLIVLLFLLLVIAVTIALQLPGEQQDPDPTTGLNSTDAPTDPPTEPPTQPLLNGWLEQSGQRYYYINGTPHTGWLTLDGQDYYFLSDGTMARGTVQIDGVNHFFSSEGIPFIVVNPWNYVPEDYKLDLVDIPAEYGSSQQVDRSCYDALIQMLADCNAAMKEQNINTSVYVVSGYRTLERQTNNFNKKVNQLLQDNPGMTREEAEKKAATVIAIPGTSEHHLGLAVDVIDTQLWSLTDAQADLPAQKWLMENCWRYGFILRYPKDAIDSTGIIYEPWHYRYLGKALAEEIHHSGLTVEQYLDSLSS